MNVTCAAPRLTASMPTAPVPANPSSTRAPSTRGVRILNSVSRSLSDVGRRPSHVGALRRRPLNRPAITRIACEPRRPAGWRAQRAFVAIPPLSNLYQPELLLPALLHELQELARQPALVHERPRLAVRGLHDVAVPHQVARAQLRQPRLPRAEEVARPAQLEVALRDRKAVAGRGQRLQPLSRVIGPRRLIHQEAVRLPFASSDAAAQLMQLRQAESLGVLYDHDRRVRHVDADLD